MSSPSSPEIFVNHRLNSDPAIVALTGYRHYAIFVPKVGGELPFVVYARKNSQGDDNLQRGPVGLPLTHLQLSAWSEDPDEARRLGDLIRQALDGRPGTVGDATIVDIRLVSEADDFVEPQGAGAQLPLAYEVRQLYQVRWQQ